MAGRVTTLRGITSVRHIAIRIRHHRHPHRRQLPVVARLGRIVQGLRLERHTMSHRVATVTTVTGHVDNTPIGIPRKIRVAVRGAV